VLVISIGKRAKRPECGADGDAGDASHLDQGNSDTDDENFGHAPWAQKFGKRECAACAVRGRYDQAAALARRARVFWQYADVMQRIALRASHKVVQRGQGVWQRFVL